MAVMALWLCRLLIETTSVRHLFYEVIISCQPEENISVLPYAGQEDEPTEIDCG